MKSVISGRRLLAVALVGVAGVACSSGNQAERGGGAPETDSRSPASRSASGGERRLMAEHPDYESIRAFKNAHALELLEKYGAHSIGIRSTGEADEEARPALAFYLDPQRDRSRAETVPPYFEYQPTAGGAVVKIPTVVIESPQADFEPGSR